jgi:cytochrome c2
MFRPNWTLVFVCAALAGGRASAQPVVAAFERALPAEAADGGLLLLAELNCTACHAAPAAWQERLAPKPAPNLDAVGSRLDAAALRSLIGNPQQYKPGTQMPGMFADGNAERVEMLVAYLSSLQGPTPAMPRGDVERGKTLYHSVGCVACHEPAADARPANIPADQQIEKPRTASVPIKLAKEYDSPALAHFLVDPLRYRPSGRMPGSHLTEQEASDVAAYLQQGSGTAKAATLATTPEQIAKGKALFVEQRCRACHSTGELASRPSVELAQLPTDRGCLATEQRSGIPHYDLNDAQRGALSLAIAAVKAGPPSKLAPTKKVDWEMARLNCYACHIRDGKGGPELARTAYFTTNDGGAESLGEFAHLPPNLDRVGRKLTREWFGKILWGEDGSVRPYMNTRMPNFGRAQTEKLIEPLEAADRLAEPVKIDVSGTIGHQRAEPGRKLIGATGLACVSCHGLKDRKSLGPPVVRLTFTVERLRPEYFKELLLNPQATQPGTMMPPLLTGRKGAEKEVETIWTYLKEVESQPLPEGLISNEDFELKPRDRPIVFRSFIEGAGTHGIGVGFAQGLNASFDAKACRWVAVWKGKFLDAMSNWQDRTMKPIAPLGTEIKTLPEESGAREFRGYRLEKSGVPVMLYSDGGVNVEDKLEPAADGKSFVHIVRRGSEAPETKEVLSW